MYKPHRGNSSPGWKGGNKFGDKKPWKRDADNNNARPMMYRATCTECGETCEVPFKPLGGRPVFCSHCFKKDEDGGAQKFGRKGGRKPAFDTKSMYKAMCATCGNACEVPFRPNGEKPVYCRQCFGNGNTSGGTSTHVDHYKEQFKLLNVKLDSILKVLTASTNDHQALSIASERPSMEAEPVKKTTKKRTASKKKTGIEKE